MQSKALDALTAAQREAAAYLDGPALVVAGPGSGKTRTLVARLTALIESGTACADELLAVTFTRKAAGELRSRLTAALGAAGQDVTVGTFHQVALLLRPLPAGVVLFGEADQAALAAQAAGAHGCANKASAASKLSAAVSRWKGSGCDWESSLAPGEDDQPRWLKPAAQSYQQGLRALGAEDLDDLLIAATLAVRAGAAARRFRFVQVDEYQDVNGVQRELLCALAGQGAQLFAIGDPDQAIYAFRGADVRHFHAFAEDFPAARTFFLRENFRSTPAVVTAANAVINHNPLRPQEAAARAMRDGGERLVLSSSASAVVEAIGVAREIERLIGGTSLSSHDQGRSAAWAAGRYGFSDIAVLTRTVARADRLAEALQHEGVPILRPRRAHLQDEAARELLACLRLLAQPDDLGAWLRLLGREGAALTLASSLASSLTDLGARRAAGALSELPPFLSELRGLAQSEQLERLARQLEASPECVAAVAAQLATPGGGLADVAPVHESDEWDERFERVAVLTLHGAKGLEFPVVFLCGCEAELLPGSRAEPQDVIEERRLFFVGLTRAKDLLYLSHVEGRPRSPFLDELPGELLLCPPPPKRKPRPPQLKLF